MYGNALISKPLRLDLALKTSTSNVRKRLDDNKDADTMDKINLNI